MDGRGARSIEPTESTPLYDKIGVGYSTVRTTDLRIAQHIWAALGDAESVLNVGAGTGSYEPPDRRVIAVEPSQVMRGQRAWDAAPCIDGDAAALPFADGSFDAAMAVLSDHHWADPIAGLKEMARVARRVVVFQLDNRVLPRFWLPRDYVPEYRVLARSRPSLAARAAAIDGRMTPVPIPWDCADGFILAYWRRPEAYLRDDVRRGNSFWTRVGSRAERRAVAALAEDLSSGRWKDRNHELLGLDEADLGARLVVAG